MSSISVFSEQSSVYNDLLLLRKRHSIISTFTSSDSFTYLKYQHMLGTIEIENPCSKAKCFLLACHSFFLSWEKGTTSQLAASRVRACVLIQCPFYIKIVGIKGLLSCGRPPLVLIESNRPRGGSGWEVVWPRASRQQIFLVQKQKPFKKVPIRKLHLRNHSLQRK